MGRMLRVALTGDHARLGQVPAADVAHLLLGLERAVARASGGALGRRVKNTGRWGKAIESAVRFRLLGIEEGSVVGILELPKLESQPDALDFDIATLGELALVSTLRIVGGEAAHPDVAGVFVAMADRIGIGSRYDAITFDTDAPGAPERVVLDELALDRLRRMAEQASPERRADTLVGVLVEADFERHTARLRTADGGPVGVTFGEDQFEEIQEALRRPAQLVGEIAYDPETARAVSVKLRAITRAEQLAMSLDAGEFWRDVTIDELRRERGMEPVHDIAQLGDPELTEDEIDAFLAALES